METTDEKPELPDICKKYDEVSDAIVNYESDIKSMDNEVTEKTEKIKEYLQILKDGTAVGITRDQTHEILEPSAVILDSLTYYRNKIQELNAELIKIDDEIKSKKANLQDYYNELEEITGLIPGSGMVKILPSFCRNYRWITLDDMKSRYKNAWYTRIV